MVYDYKLHLEIRTLRACPWEQSVAEVNGKYYNIWYMCKDKRVYNLGIVRNLDKIDFTKFTIGLSYLHASEREKYILLGEVR